MKPFLIGAFLHLAFLSCNTRIATKKESMDKSETQVVGKKFFDYDAIDYYKTAFDKSKIAELYDNKSNSEIDSLKMEIIVGKMPNGISDLTFLDKLTTVGYTKSTVVQSKFGSIDKIFSEKESVAYTVTSCIAIYRDILIFKKGSKVIGTAKICFDCTAHQIHGTSANTAYFGQDGDYKKLAEILR